MWRVYVHTNKINGMKYVGRTSLTMSKRCHKGEGYKPRVGSSPFYDAIKEFGWSNFKTEVLYQNLTAEESAKLEKALIRNLETHISTGKGYNATWGGEPCSGWCPSEETRRKISEANKGRTHSEEAKRKMSEARKGRKQSYETKLKIGISMYKKKNPNCSDKEAEEVVKFNLKEQARLKALQEEKRNMTFETEFLATESTKEDTDYTLSNAEELYAKYYGG